eukprot:3941367-Rhodomonas_salina.1
MSQKRGNVSKTKEGKDDRERRKRDKKGSEKAPPKRNRRLSGQPPGSSIAYLSTGHCTAEP